MIGMGVTDDGSQNRNYSDGDDECRASDANDAVFYRADPFLYHKFDNMVIFRPGKFYSLSSPGNQDYQKIIHFYIINFDRRTLIADYDFLMKKLKKNNFLNISFLVENYPIPKFVVKKWVPPIKNGVKVISSESDHMWNLSGMIFFIFAFFRFFRFFFRIFYNFF